MSSRRRLQTRGRPSDFTRPLADKKNLAVHLHLPEDPPTMHSDAGKIQQIIYNLMSNAIKFTSEGEVVVSCRVHKSNEESVELYFSVRDTGIGISEDKLKLSTDSLRKN